uniref:Uncharacterized protein n=1 Tax=Meloidogyne incognita TaxID=6306 RepID=A0A914NXY8_MELIC
MRRGIARLRGDIMLHQRNLFLYDYKWKLDRQVKNPEWILWFWAPIVFVMYVITRFVWSLLLDNQGINFPNVVNAAESVTVENDGIIEIDEEKLNDRLNVIAENFSLFYILSSIFGFHCL